MAEKFTLTYQPPGDDGLVVVALSGELDFHDADRARQGLTGAALSPGCRGVRVNLAQLEFIDSSGLGALVAGYKTATAAGVGYAVANPNRLVRQVLDTTRLGELLGLSPAD